MHISVLSRYVNKIKDNDFIFLSVVLCCVSVLELLSQLFPSVSGHYSLRLWDWVWVLQYIRQSARLLTECVCRILPSGILLQAVVIVRHALFSLIPVFQHIPSPSHLSKCSQPCVEMPEPLPKQSFAHTLPV